MRLPLTAIVMASEKTGIVMAKEDSAQQSVAVLIVGGGPVGLGLATDLGWRGIECLLVEKGDGTFPHPRANAINARTMEFCRRWGVAQAVHESGAPPDYPHTAMYLTSLAGFEIARIERASHGGATSSQLSPERPQRCNQMFFDPILLERAKDFPTVTVRTQCRFDSFEESEDDVIAEITDLKTERRERIAARYLVACCGGQSPIRDALGIEMDGTLVQSYPTDVFFRAPELWNHHDKGKGALYFLVAPTGVWASLNSINGNDLWRLTVHGTKTQPDPAAIDAEAWLARAVGSEFPHEIISMVSWVRRELVARQYSKGNVFLAGDSAHMNSPSGGYGMNTGMGDAVDLGWKLAASLEGWGGAGLLASYEAERRAVAQRNVNAATGNSEFRKFQVSEAVTEDNPEGAEIRQLLHEKFMDNSKQRFDSQHIALGYGYDHSPICWTDGAAAASPDATPDPGQFKPSSRPGYLAPHALLEDGRSTLDLFGCGFVLLRFGEDAPEAAGLAEAARERGVPFEVHRIGDAAIDALYEKKLVLVRPDGHVAWRSDTAPAKAGAVIDRVRGA